MSKLDEAYEKAMNDCPSKFTVPRKNGCDKDSYYLCVIHQDPKVIAEKVARALLAYAKENQNDDHSDFMVIGIDKLEEFFK